MFLSSNVIMTDELRNRVLLENHKNGSGGG